MSTSLVETVSNFIPSFEDVNVTETSQFSLVLSEPAAVSPASNKMQKKLNYEAGIKSTNTNRRLLNNISKTFHKQQQQQQKQQRVMKRSLTKSSSANTSSTNLNSLKSSNANVAALRAADRGSPNVRPIDRKSSMANLRSSSVGTSERKIQASTGLRSSSATRPSNLKASITTPVRQSELSKSTTSPKAPSPKFQGNLELRKSLARSTVEVNKNELSRSVTSPKTATPTLQRKNSSPNFRASGAMSSPKTAAPSLQRQSSFTNLKSSGFMRPTAASALKASTNVLKQSVGSPSIRSPLANTTVISNSPLRSSGRITSSPMRRPLPIGGSTDALNVLMFDFEAQKKRALRLTQAEQDIFKQELMKYEEKIEKKQKQSEASNVLLNNIKNCESRLAGLFVELENKQTMCNATKEELSAVTKEFEVELQAKEAEITGVTSAKARMQQAAVRRALKDQWKNAEDPVAQARFRLLQAQEDITETEAEINALKKELGRFKNHASKARSSDSRLKEEQRLREHMRTTGQVRERGQYVRPKGTVKSNEKKAYVARLEEEKAKRAAKRAAAAPKRQSTVADLIASQAGMSRGRYGASPFRAAATASRS